MRYMYVSHFFSVIYICVYKNIIVMYAFYTHRYIKKIFKIFLFSEYLPRCFVDGTRSLTKNCLHTLNKIAIYEYVRNDERITLIFRRQEKLKKKVELRPEQRV